MAANRKFLFMLTFCSVLIGMFLTTGSVMQPPETRRKMEISSTAFKNGQPIPARYTCDDKNVSPPLAWSGVPGNAASLLLIVDDPDAPTGVWTHWVLFNLPASTGALAEDAVNSQSFPAAARQGVNDFKREGYNGPCSPAGKPHRYYFKIFALDIQLNVPAGASRQTVEAAMTKHVLAQGQLMGTYQRQ